MGFDGAELTAHDDHVQKVSFLDDGSRLCDLRLTEPGHGDEDVRLLDAGLLQDVAVEARTDEGLAVEALVEVLEGGRVLVDDADGEAALAQLICQLRAHPSAAHDHRVHSSNDTRAAPGLCCP